jgi:hypothetical protein
VAKEGEKAKAEVLAEVLVVMGEVTPFSMKGGLDGT